MGANVTAIDRDPEAVSAARKRLAAEEAEGRFHVILGNFAEADRLLPRPVKRNSMAYSPISAFRRIR